jgi:hypothetical protein
MKPLLHADNRPIKFLSMQDQSRLYIGLLWSHRGLPRIRSIIRGHVRMIRRWEASWL